MNINQKLPLKYQPKVSINPNFSSPQNRYFACCGDMDHASEHTLFSSLSGNTYDDTHPFIIITDYGTFGCPAQKENCSRDEIISLTPKEKYTRLVKNVSQEKISIQPKKELNNIHTTAFVYTEINELDVQIQSYLLYTDTETIKISFHHADQFEEGFIDTFLEKIIY